MSLGQRQRLSEMAQVDSLNSVFAYILMAGVPIAQVLIASVLHVQHLVKRCG